ncbi:hypothetical protein K470DRAFT_137359 [Piedraia hortae CBS 480.64]|uniref:Uncharacterized protein n=1 Tax=Piedraia hortae CBS 480.64 TaxID=1314780 RepID=A0A6A7BSV3_9PEZI|nr:hypothetical protein K470DRAFT_137359 [Piedraia hortae CBS 480.64]
MRTRGTSTQGTTRPAEGVHEAHPHAKRKATSSHSCHRWPSKVYRSVSVTAGLAHRWTAPPPQRHKRNTNSCQLLGKFYATTRGGRRAVSRTDFLKVIGRCVYGPKHEPMCVQKNPVGWMMVVGPSVCYTGQPMGPTSGHVRPHLATRRGHAESDHANDVIRGTGSEGRLVKVSSWWHVPAHIRSAPGPKNTHLAIRPATVDYSSSAKAATCCA